MRMPRLKWSPHPDVLILIVLFIVLVGALRIVYRPRLIKNSPYLIHICIDEQIPPFREHWLTISTSGKIDWTP